MNLEFSDAVEGGHHGIISDHLNEADEYAVAAFERHGLIVPKMTVVVDYLDPFSNTAATVKTEDDKQLVFMWFSPEEVALRKIPLEDTVDTLAHERAHILRGEQYRASEALIDLVADEGIAHHIGTAARWLATGSAGDEITRLFARALADDTASTKINEHIDYALAESYEPDKIMDHLMEPRTVDEGILYYALAIHLGIYEVGQHRNNGVSFSELLNMGSREVVDTWLF